MISCDAFRVQFTPSTDDAALLEHVRACDACLAFAGTVDPDALFRALGGQELLPPGGVDAFVEDVMRELRLRSTETSLTRRPASWTRRAAIAATIALGLIGGAAIYQVEQTPESIPVRIARAPQRPVILTTRSVVESYDSETATIVEVPTEGEGNVTVVMVFDETLPADL